MSTLTPVSIEPASKGSKKYVYTFKIPALDITSASLIEITDSLEEYDVYIKYNPNEVYIKTVYEGNNSSDSIVLPEYPAYSYPGSVENIDTVEGLNPDDITLDKDGNVVTHYRVHCDNDMTVEVIPFEDCKITGALVKHASLRASNSYTVKVNYEFDDKGNDFIIKSSHVRTAKVIDEDEKEVKPKNGAYNVKPNSNYTVRIADGRFANMDLEGDDDRMVRIEAKVGTTDVTSKVLADIIPDADISDNYEFDEDEEVVVSGYCLDKDTFDLSFHDDSIIGKSIVITVYENGKSVSKIKFNVAPYAAKAQITGEKSGVLQHPFLTSKAYKVKITPAAYDAKNVVILAEYRDYNNGNIWKTIPVEDDQEQEFAKYCEGILTITATDEVLSEIAPAEGFPELRVKFYDSTIPGFKLSDGDSGIPVGNTGVLDYIVNLVIEDGAVKGVVLEDGEIVGKGTSKELLDNCEVYKEIYNTQFQEVTK